VQLARVIVGWLAVSLVFLGLDALRARRAGTRPTAPRWLHFAQAVPFTLLAALWFASIGRGSWPLVFVLIAIVAESPRLADLGKGRGLRVAGAMLPTVVRMLAGALVLRWLL
jgi:hypothetical protein